MKCTLNTEWLNFLEDSRNKILGRPELAYKNTGWEDIPKTAGVCLITVGDKGYFVGSTRTNLKKRIEQILTNKAAVPSMKEGLVDSGECVNQTAEQWLQQNAAVSWIEVEDMKTRGALKCYLTGVLFPKFGITEEH